MNEIEKEFYSHIGLLSVRFAQMENNLSSIIGRLLQTNDSLIALIVIDSNTISKNIDLLQKVNNLLEFEKEKINHLIKSINKVKPIRNQFIHGYWQEPYYDQAAKKMMIVCEERKVKHTKEPNKSNKNFINKVWSINHHQDYDIVFIQKEIKIIEEIINIQDDIITKLEEKNPDLMFFKPKTK